jgi:hypothetical protein
MEIKTGDILQETLLTGVIKEYIITVTKSGRIQTAGYLNGAITKNNFIAFISRMPDLVIKRL